MSALSSSSATSVGDRREVGMRAALDHRADPAVAIMAQLDQLQSMLYSARTFSPLGARTPVWKRQISPRVIHLGPASR
eukprot:7633548-Karenia_brevis.AAC.1